jgi:transposase InsO family protein
VKNWKPFWFSNLPRFSAGTDKGFGCFGNSGRAIGVVDRDWLGRLLASFNQWHRRIDGRLGGSATARGDAVQQAPRFLIRDRDSKYGEAFTRVAVSSGIEILRTPYRAPTANAIGERFLGSVRRECLDQVLILGARHRYRIVKEYVQFFNCARPHQGIQQRVPVAACSIPEKVMSRFFQR